jgi:hypothetical protein
MAGSCDDYYDDLMHITTSLHIFVVFNVLFLSVQLCCFKTRRVNSGRDLAPALAELRLHCVRTHVEFTTTSRANAHRSLTSFDPYASLNPLGRSTTSSQSTLPYVAGCTNSQFQARSNHRPGQTSNELVKKYRTYCLPGWFEQFSKGPPGQTSIRGSSENTKRGPSEHAAMKAAPLLISWHDDSQPIYSVHFDPHGKGRLATAGHDHNVRVRRDSYSYEEIC